MEKALKTDIGMAWEFETDVLNGICEIALDEMSIVFKFTQQFSNEFFDVLAIKAAILERLAAAPISVENAVVFCKQNWPKLDVEVRGRAESHGWIKARA